MRLSWRTSSPHAPAELNMRGPPPFARFPPPPPPDARRSCCREASAVGDPRRRRSEPSESRYLSVGPSTTKLHASSGSTPPALAPAAVGPRRSTLRHGGRSAAGLG